MREYIQPQEKERRERKEFWEMLGAIIYIAILVIGFAFAYGAHEDFCKKVTKESSLYDQKHCGFLP